jgi:TonB family protein
MKWVGSLIVVVFFAAAFAQTGDKRAKIDDWCRIESPSRDFAFSLPCEGFLVDNEDHSFRIYYQKDGFSLSITMTASQTAKDDFNAGYKFLRDPERSKYTFFHTGDFMGRQANERIEDKNHRSTWLHLASSNGSYTVTSSSEINSDIQYHRFIGSIKLGNTPLFGKTEVFPAETQTLIISSLKTDEIILKALRAPEPKETKLEKLKDKSEITGDEQNYSRELILIRKPIASYTDSARQDDVNGTVVLKVMFLADGTLGQIKLISSLERSLDNQAFKAAKKIKFLPAEVNGKPVDVWRQIEYSFSIY